MMSDVNRDRTDTDSEAEIPPVVEDEDSFGGCVSSTAQWPNRPSPKVGRTLVVMAQQLRMSAASPRGARIALCLVSHLTARGAPCGAGIRCESRNFVDWLAGILARNYDYPAEFSGNTPATLEMTRDREPLDLQP